MNVNWQNDTEYVALVEDLMNHDHVQRLDQFVHHHITTRLAHSTSVSYHSYRWAKRFGLDTRSIARAALLHDLFFYECADNKCYVGGKGHNFEHPRIALANALHITELSDKERDIILKHMAGATLDMPRYAESLIVSLMDKRCAITEASWFVRARLSTYFMQLRKWGEQPII